ncbi:MAG: TetR/AcrR family transcriptional regulator [Myxococcota bacterium]
MSTPAAQQRRLQHREEARRSILDATESLLVDEGYDGFSMRRLAERCGYTAPTLYHYFSDKESLIEALLAERLVQLVADLRAVPTTGDALEDLRARCLAFVSWGLRNPTHYRLMVLPRESERPPSAEGEAARELLVRPFDALARSGRLNTPDGELARQTLWALLHGLILLQSTRPDEEWLPDLAGQAIDAVIRGSLRESEALQEDRET